MGTATRIEQTVIICHSLLMTNEAEKSAGLVPIRLEAKPMRSLGTTIRNLFYSDDTKNAEYDRLREGEGRPQPLMFLSRQVAYLDLGIADGVGNPDDVADDTAYTEQVAGVTSRMITEEVVPSFQISLPTELKVTRRSIELGVTLQFRNDEDKEAIVAPPLFPEGFNERVTMFPVSMPQRRAASRFAAHARICRPSTLVRVAMAR